MATSTDSGPPAKRRKQSTEEERSKEVKFNNSRVKQLHGRAGAPTNVSAVAYYMHRDQRVQDNWALVYAQSLALRHHVPLHVVTLVTSTHPRDAGATLRHLTFCFDGLKEVSEELKTLNIAFHFLLCQDTETSSAEITDTEASSAGTSSAETSGAGSSGAGSSSAKIVEWMELVGVNCLVADFSPLRQHRSIIKNLTSLLPDSITIYQVDAHNIVPVEVTSEKQEYAARTIRNKINSKLNRFLTEFPPITKHPHGSADTTLRHFAGRKGTSKDLIEDWDTILKTMRLDNSVPPSSLYRGGTKSGMECLETFVKKRIKLYNDKRNDPTVDALSNLSPWFHMGNLSVQRAVLYVKKHAPSYSSSFIEEAVIRRELSDNFCYYNPNYDNIRGASDWAQKTLQDHQEDKREYIYSRQQFSDARTHDPLWNAAQRQLTVEGKMHGFMRMYWAKKILEWTRNPEEALEVALFLNDHYSLDGNDANGYVGCMWSICGIHDQGWREREVFGKIRFMNFNGCKRKFDIDKYIAKFGGKATAKK